MAKQVSFKCRFGHVTNKTFEEVTPSEIECEMCKKEETSAVMKYEHPMNDKDYRYNWPSKKLLAKYKIEMAVRI